MKFLFSCYVKNGCCCAFRKIKDIDSPNMQIFVRQGRQKRDRFAMLLQNNLEILREYWKQYRPKDWLFNGREGKCYTTHAIQIMMDRNLKRLVLTSRRRSIRSDIALRAI